MPEISELHRVDLQSGRITKLRWSHDGRFLAIPTQSGSTAIFDIDAGEVTQTLEGRSEVTAVGWDPRSNLIMTCALDRSIALWELEGGRSTPFTLSGHRKPVHSVQWTDEGAFALTCSPDRIRALDGCCLLAGWTKEMEDGVNKTTGFTAAGCSGQSSFLLAMAAQNGDLLVLANLMSADVLDSIEMEQPVRTLAWSPAEELLAVGSGDGIVTFRATHEGFLDPAPELTPLAPKVHALAFSDDGRVLASRDAQGLKIWDVAGATLIVALDEKIETLTSSLPPPEIAFHPARPLLATVNTNGTAFRIVDLSQLARSWAG